MRAARTGSTSCGGSCARRPDHLTPEGALVCEIGRGRGLVVRDYPDLPFVWLDTEESEGEVFLLRASDFAPPQRRPKRKALSAYSAAARIMARMLARKSSIGVSRPARSTCQKVQPLQAGSPCTSAPILWIEPIAGPAASAPSARTSAEWRRRMSTIRSPGATRPASTTLAKATRGSLRRVGAVATASVGKRLDRVDALARGGGVSRIALDADEGAAEPARDRAGRAGAEERIEHEIAGVRGREQHAREQRLGLLRRMGLAARRRPSAAPRPVQIGRNQSERA